MATSNNSLEAVHSAIKQLSPTEYDEIISRTGLSYSSVRNAVGLLRMQGHVAVSVSRPAVITFLKEVPKAGEVIVIEKEKKNPSITAERKEFLRAELAKEGTPYKFIGTVKHYVEEGKDLNSLYTQMLNMVEVLNEDYILPKAPELDPEIVAARLIK